MRSLTIFSNIGIYVSLNIGQAILQIALIPIYTFYLTPDEFGYYTSIIALATLLMAVNTLGYKAVAQRFSTGQYDRGIEVDVNIYAQAILFSGIFAALCLLVVNATGSILNIPITGLYYGIAYASFMSPLSVYLENLRAREKGKSYALIMGGYTLTTVLLTISLILLTPLSYLSPLISSALIAAIICIGIFIRDYKGDKVHINTQQLAYGLRIIPHFFIAACFMMADRFLLALYSTQSDVGIYGIASAICSVLMMISLNIGIAFRPHIFSALDKHDKTQINKIAITIGAMLGIFSAGFILFAQYTLLLIGKDFSAFTTVIPILTIRATCHGIFAFSICFLTYHHKKNFIVLICSGAALSLLILISPYTMNESYFPTLTAISRAAYTITAASFTYMLACNILALYREPKLWKSVFYLSAIVIAFICAAFLYNAWIMNLTNNVVFQITLKALPFLLGSSALLYIVYFYLKERSSNWFSFKYLGKPFVISKSHLNKKQMKTTANAFMPSGLRSSTYKQFIKLLASIQCLRIPRRFISEELEQKLNDIENILSQEYSEDKERGNILYLLPQDTQSQRIYVNHESEKQDIFWKVAFDLDNKNRLEKEFATLTTIHAHNFESFSIPQLYPLIRRNSLLALGMNNLEIRTSKKLTKTKEQKLLRALIELRDAHAKTTIITDTSWWNENTFNEINSKYNIFDCEATDIAINTSWCNGDIAPQNLSFVKDSLYILDWEDFSKDAPQLSDTIRYFALKAKQKYGAAPSVKIIEYIQEKANIPIQDILLSALFFKTRDTVNKPNFMADFLFESYSKYKQT